MTLLWRSSRCGALDYVDEGYEAGDSEPCVSCGELDCVASVVMVFGVDGRRTVRRELGVDGGREWYVLGVDADLRRELGALLVRWRERLVQHGRPIGQRVAAELAGVSQSLWGRAERGRADLPMGAVLAFLRAAERGSLEGPDGQRVFHGDFVIVVALAELADLALSAARSRRRESPATRPAGIPAKGAGR